MNNEARKVVENMQRYSEANAFILSKLTEQEQLQAARKGYEGTIPMAGESEEVWKVQNITIEGADKNAIPLRIYQPIDKKQLPILLFIHGGGFTAGSLETHDRPLRKLANQSGFLIIAVDYRLAPEYPFPAAINDCYSALQWVENNAEQINVDRQKIVVGGDSAGGNLATVTALMNRDKGATDIAAQILIYPNTDLSLNSATWTSLGDKGYVLTKEGMTSNVSSYVGDNDKINHHYISPLHSEDLSGLPETLIVTGGHDPLHAEGEAYAEKLQKTNSNVTHWHYDGQIHGFFQFGAVISEGNELITRISDFLKNSI